MSQRNLKGTVCSGSHSRLHCTFICKSCGGDYRQCDCETVNHQLRPNKRQRNAEARDTDSEHNNKELQKRCDSLLKDHERLAQAFRNQLANYQGESVRELEQMCRKSLRSYMPLMSTMRREGQLLPLKFDQRFYECSFTCNKNGSFKSHHVFKSQWPIIKINW